jgi:hypothetical protein
MRIFNQNAFLPNPQLMPICFLRLLLASLLWTSTPGETTLLKHIDGKINSITSDRLQNLYLVKNDVLEKYDANGTFLFSYSLSTLGQIDFVDAGDPMKPLVFYKSFASFMVLDNTLTPSGDPVALEQYGLEQVNLACTSYDRGFWCYNPANMELLHLNADDLVQNITTGNISQILNEAIHPNFLTEQNNKVFLNDPALGILVFDIYGGYYKTIPIKSLNRFQISGDQVIYFSAKQIMTYNFKTLIESSLPVPDSTATAVRIEKERLFILNDKGVDIYSAK